MVTVTTPASQGSERAPRGGGDAAPPVLRMLLVEDSAGDARLLREMIAEYGAHAIEMAHVAVAPGLAPTRISFHRALLVVAEGLREVTRPAPTKWPAWHGLMRSSMASLVLPERRSDRTYPRAMKMPVGRYARKLPSRA